MPVQEMIARGYTVSVRPPTDAADGYHIVYTLRGTQGGLGEGLFHALKNGGPAVPAPTQLEAIARLSGEEVVVRWANAQELEAIRDLFALDVQSRVRHLHVWLSRLAALINDVETWVKALGWSTRRIEKPMEDSHIGKYKAPGLIMQEGTDRVLLEPIGRSAPGTEGVVDLYLMPAYDDVATLYYFDGRWNLYTAVARAAAVQTVRDAPAKPLSKETLQEVLEQMKQNAA